MEKRDWLELEANHAAAKLKIFPSLDSPRASLLVFTIFSAGRRLREKDRKEGRTFGYCIYGLVDKAQIQL
jgi:hypothetical protein